MYKRISCEDLSTEIKSMLEEFFVCNCSNSENEIFMEFENGQEFVLSITKK